MWRISPLTGECCTSWTSAVRFDFSPAISSSTRTFSPEAWLIIALMSRAETCNGCGLSLPPYMIAGITPCAFSLRTAERPTVARGSAFSLTCFAIFFVFDVEQRRHRLVVMYPFDAFPEKLGDAQHRNLKAIHRVDRRAVGGY